MSQLLPPELDSLLFRGVCSRGDTDDVWQFMLDVAQAVEAGDITARQADALCAMLGASQAEFDAARSRASN